MASWKQYGGRHYQDTNNFFHASGITCDDLTILNAYNGSLDINGSLSVSGNVVVGGNIDLCSNLILGNLTVRNNTLVQGNLEVVGPLIIDSTLRFGNPLQGSLVVRPNGSLFWDVSAGPLIISGAGPDVFSVEATGPVCQTVLGKNGAGRGVSLLVNDNQSFLFYGNTPGTIDAVVAYLHDLPGTILNSLVLDVCGGQVYVMPYLVVGSSPLRSRLGEQQTLYDVSSGSLFPDVYSVDSNKGQALSVLNSSGNGTTTVSLMNGVSASHGLTVVGGVFPNDSTRSFGFASASADGFAPSLSLVSGNTLVNASTIGINTYAPTTDTCVLDINGPVRIHHGEIHHTYTTTFPIYATGYNGSTFVSIGDPVLVGSKNVHYALVSNDSMVSWNSYPIDLGYNDSSGSYQAVYVDTSFVFVGGNQDFLFYSNNQGRNWYNIQTYDSTTFKSLYSTLVSPSILRVYGTYTNTTSISIPSTTYTDISLNLLQAGGDISIPFSSYHDFYDLTVLRNLIVSGNGTYIYTLGPSRATPGNTLFQRYDLSMNPLVSLNFSTSFNNLQVFPTGIVLLGGPNYFYSRSFAPNLVSDFSSNNVIPTSVSLTSSYWYNASHAVLVGQDSSGGVGAFYSSDNGLTTFRSVPNSVLNQQGNARQLLRYGLTDVWMTGLGSFLIGGLYGPSLHQYFSVALPDIFDPLDNPVLSIAGRVDICGNLYAAHLFGLDASFGNLAVGTLQGNDISASHISVSSFDASFGHFDAANVAGGLVVGGLLDASSALIQNVLTTPFLQVRQESALYGNLAIGQNLVVGGQVSATSLSNFGPLQQLGNVYVHNSVSVSQNMLVQGSLGAASANILETLYVSGFLSPPQAYNTNSESIAIGAQAGVSQSYQSISLGFQAGQTNQQPGTIAIGTTAGNSLQGLNSIALGSAAGADSQGPGSIALGNGSGETRQSDGCIAIGTGAGNYQQNASSIAIGANAGQSNQFPNSIAIGNRAGGSAQNMNSIAIGNNAGNEGQGSGSIAFGGDSGSQNQGAGSIAFGFQAGNNHQGASSIAFGTGAGSVNQGVQCIAFGLNAGYIGQTSNALAFGSGAGFFEQGNNSTAVGNGAGYTSQSNGTTAIGNNAGQNYQGEYAIAIGSGCAGNYQGTNSIAIGNYSSDYQGDYAVVVGSQTGRNQGDHAIAVGFNAVQDNQETHSICLNATGNAITASNQGLYIQPIRPLTQSNTLFYDPTGGEITYGDGGVLSYVSQILPVGVDLSQNYYNTSYFSTQNAPGHTYSTVVYDCSFNPGYYNVNMTVYLLVKNNGFSMDSMALSMSSDPYDFSNNLLAPLKTQFNYGYSCLSPNNPELFSIQLSSVVHFTVATHAYFNFSIYKNPGNAIISTTPITGPKPIQYSYTFTQIG